MTGLIALEEHFAIPDTVRDSLTYSIAGGWSELESRLLDLNGQRLQRMDECGVKFALLSLNSPGIQAIEDTATAVDVARRANDALAAAVVKYPTRFGGFAALPMQEPDAAITELRRAVRDLGLAGVLVNGFSTVARAAGVAYYDAPEYLPFWAELEQLGVPFYLHPRDPLLTREPILQDVPWLQGSAWAFQVETATHALRLITCGILDRYPRLTIVLGHLGEGLPFCTWRIDHRMRRSPRGVPAQATVTEYLRRNFYVTTSGQFRTEALINTIAEMGIERILFSIDYPFEDMEEAVTWFRGLVLPADNLARIGWQNASRLFGLRV